jgi:CelD/BcsL family acetyltransferase involved in cellulose biosynthesis
MRSSSFQFPWMKHFAAKNSLRVLVYEEENQIVGIFPLIEERRIWTGRTLINVGSGKACYDDLGILSEPWHADSVARAFATYLVDTTDLAWDYLDLDGIRPDNLGMKVFASEFETRSEGSVDRRVEPSCWALDLTSDADGYHVWPKRLRSMMRKSRTERETGVFEVNVASTPEQAMAELEVIMAMHQSRWESRGIDGCFSNPAFAELVKDLILENWPRKASVVAVLRWNGIPAAGCVCFRDSSTWYFYVSSMAPEFAEQKPGWKLNGYFADLAIVEGCTRMDFMRGDEIYKQRLGAKPSQQERWLISSQKLRGRLQRAIYRTAREIKHYIAPPSPAQVAPVLETSMG